MKSTPLSFLFRPTALDVISPVGIIFSTPSGIALTGILIVAVMLVTVWLIRRFYGKKKK